MNPAHIHLLVNHAPLFALLGAFGLLVWGLVRSREAIQQAGLVVVILAAVAVAPAYLSGEGAEDIVENSPVVTEALIEAHEEAALIAAVLTVVAGVTAAGALLVAAKKPEHARLFAAVTLVDVLLAVATMGYTANLGGQISHPEIRNEAGAAAFTGGVGAGAGGSGAVRPDTGDDDD